jgi:hypothetical protein
MLGLVQLQHCMKIAKKSLSSGQMCRFEGFISLNEEAIDFFY